MKKFLKLHNKLTESIQGDLLPMDHKMSFDKARKMLEEEFNLKIRMRRSGNYRIIYIHNLHNFDLTIKELVNFFKKCVSVYAQDMSGKEWEFRSGSYLEIKAIRMDVKMDYIPSESERIPGIFKKLMNGYELDDDERKVILRMNIEDIVKSDKNDIFTFADRVIKGRWLKAENRIKELGIWDEYVENVIKKHGMGNIDVSKDPHAEDVIASII